MTSLRKYLTLNSGRRIPTVGLGTFLMKNDVLREALDYALYIGYRHIDTALSYGNEVEIGDVVASRIKDGTVKRADLFITTKIPPIYLDYQDCLQSAEKSLDNLKLKYVDMLLIHHPCGNPNRGDGNFKPLDENGEREIVSYDILRTWKAMEKLVGENQTVHIGLSNCQPTVINKIWKAAKIKPSNLQLECHAYLQQKELGKLCTERGIIMTSYGALGAITRPNQSGNKPVLLDDLVIKEIASRINRTPGEVLLNYVAQLNRGILPKSQTKIRLKQNIEVLDWCLSKEDIKLIQTLDRNVKYFDFPWAKNHPDYVPNQPF
ncbi:prostaglandin F synthase 1 [Patella vulgata]|uniref:prostaglandin F synthase 1 n=1 Tax=Patella vulgata TaxID=6465 RepID=UPI0021805092|nr:prostaglandin F synthase 1 [Patella vulgata]XP_050389352.1 prostaglandin F synthase 1 [Patella vulgata]